MARTKLSEKEKKHRNVICTRNWKRRHPEETNEQKKRYYSKSLGNAVNRRRGWTSKEIEEILTSPLSDNELSIKLGRSVQAIQVKRAKCKKEKYE